MCKTNKLWLILKQIFNDIKLMYIILEQSYMGNILKLM